MDLMARFGEYAGEFEKTFEDDDWTRLEQFFDPGVRYVVTGTTYDCELRGRDAVFAGLKKALDGMDRRFDQRGLEPIGEAVARDGRVVFPVKVLYAKEGVAPLSFTLVETAEYDDAGRIVVLRDDYDAGQDHVAPWLEAHAAEFDPRYE